MTTNSEMWPETQLMGYTNESLANIYRDFVIDQMGLHYPEWEFDQWLAMDAFDLSLSIEDNYAKYIHFYRLEFDL